MDRTVFIAVEVKKRELSAKVLLGSYLVSKGYNVVIGVHYKIRELAANCKSAILIDKDFSDFKIDVYKNIKKNGGYIVALDEEGIIYLDQQIYIQRVGDKVISMIDHLFLWGPDQLSMIEKKNTAIKSKCTIVGNPRMDLLGKNAKFFYDDAIKKIKQQYGNYVLYNSNFVKTEYSLLDMMKHAFNRELTEEENLKIKNLTKKRELYNSIIIDCIKRLANDLNIKIIFRPHPADVNRIWEEIFSDTPNIVVTSEGDAITWTLGADVMIHTGCTTGLEGYLCGKPSIYFDPLLDDDEEIPFPNKLSEVARNYEELVDSVNKFTSDTKLKNYFTEGKLKYIMNYILLDKNELCIEKMYQVISRFPGEGCDFKAKMNWRGFFEKWIRKQINKVRGRKSSGIDKFPITAIKEIRDLIKKSSKALYFNDTDIVVKYLDNNLFLFKPRKYNRR